jgi:hypothetical protein
LALNVLWVDGDACHWADLDTLRLVKMPDTLGAFGGVNFVNFLAQIDRLIRALGLAHIAVDAFVGDHQCHGAGSAKFCKVDMHELSTTGISPNDCRAVVCPKTWAR